MGIYFDDNQRNGTPYPRSTFGEMLILWICIGLFGTVACYLRQLVQEKLPKAGWQRTQRAIG